MSAMEYDVIVIGSGFGAAVAACRLAEAGRSVLVLERGHRWTPDTYPRDESDPWLWNQLHPQRFNGWADLRVFSNMSVVAAAGVGGGSLIYANVSVEAKPDAFDRGWPPEITYDALKPYYERVGWMLSVQEVPDNQISERTRLLRDAADACGWGDRFRKLPLAVSFSPTYDPSLPDARDDRHSVKYVNVHGVTQGTCVHCGNCDIGCQVSAKNTLDLNYLAVAERHGARILPLHVVQKLEPLDPGWRVHFDVIDPAAGSCAPGTATAAKVIVGAGSIGSTELLLRCRDEHRTLPNLSPRLGWAGPSTATSSPPPSTTAARSRRRTASPFPPRSTCSTGAPPMVRRCSWRTAACPISRTTSCAAACSVRMAGSCERSGGRLRAISIAMIRSTP